MVTVHDLFFLKHPELTEAEIRRDYVPLVRDHVRRADGVVCGSQYTASELRRLLDVPPEKIAVTPYGVDPIYRAPMPREEVDAVLAHHLLPRGALLYVGSQEERKNLVTLVMAYMGLARKRHSIPPLVLVGPGSDWAQGGTISGPQIRATGYLETREIRALMAASSLLVLPSLEEGFGLPVAEAMCAGLPVVCSRGSALEEVADGAATLVDPRDASTDVLRCPRSRGPQTERPAVLSTPAGMEGTWKRPVGSRTVARPSASCEHAADDRPVLECGRRNRVDLPRQHALARRYRRQHDTPLGGGVLSERVHAPHRNETPDESSSRLPRPVE